MGDEALSKSQLEKFTYQITTEDYTLDYNLPAQSDLPGLRPHRKPPVFNLGVLDKLPLELVQELLAFLDLCSLAQFRRVNRRALNVVDCIPQYKTITTYTPLALQCIRAVGTGQWISCNTLYEKLCTAECEECGDFAGYLYILTCVRICFLCLSRNIKYTPLRPSQAEAKFGLNAKVLRNLPRMKAVPGKYSPKQKNIQEPLVLVDMESAKQEGILLHGSASVMRQHVYNTYNQMWQEKLKLDKSCIEEETQMLRFHHLRAQLKEYRFDGTPANPLRFLAIIRIPWFNRVSQELEWGFHCIACQDSYHSRSLYPRRKFTAASFGEHLRQYGSIRDGKHYRGRSFENNIHYQKSQQSELEG